VRHYVGDTVYLTIKETFRLRASQTNCEMIAPRKRALCCTFSPATRAFALKEFRGLRINEKKISFINVQQQREKALHTYIRNIMFPFNLSFS